MACGSNGRGNGSGFPSFVVAEQGIEAWPDGQRGGPTHLSIYRTVRAASAFLLISDRQRLTHAVRKACGSRLMHAPHLGFIRVGTFDRLGLSDLRDVSDPRRISRSDRQP